MVSKKKRNGCRGRIFEFMTKEEQKIEFIKCMESPEYFINKYVKVQHPVKGLIPFELYGFQKNVLSDFTEHQFNIILKSRQMGLSTLVSAYCLWLMLFNKNKNILVVSLKQDDAKDIVSKIRLAHENLPLWLQSAYDDNNRLSIKFTNGSEIKASSTTKKSGIGQALSLLIIDEAAHVDNADDLWTSAQPALSTGGNAIILSTPFGVGNWFHKMWVKAIEGGKEFEGFKANELHWSLHPERNEQWRKIEGEKLGDPRKGAEAYDCSFLASGRTIIAGELIIEYQNACNEPQEKLETGLWRFITPVIDHKYMVCVDSAASFGQDFSAFHILDTSALKVEQVASYKAHISATEFANMLVNVCLEHNGCPLVVERNGPGLALLEQLINLEYAGLVYCANDLSAFNLGCPVNIENMGPGFPTSIRTRPLLMNSLEEFLRTKNVILHDERTVAELLTFIEKSGKYQAMGGFNDDLIMSLAIGLYMSGAMFRQFTRGSEMTKQLITGMKRTTQTDEKVNTTPIGRSAAFYNGGKSGTGKQYWQQQVRSGTKEDLKWLLD